MFAAGAYICAPPPAFAQDASQTAPWYKTITVNYFAEGSYSYNFGYPNSDINAFRVFDYHNQKLELEMAEVVVQRPALNPGDFGFRMDATAGQSVPQVTASYGLFRDSSTGEAHDYDAHQIYVRWVAPLGHGLELDAGKFITPFGYETIDGYDGYNDNETRSLLFGYAIPFTHTGIRASYAFSEKVSATAMVVQGWDDWKDNNGAKSAVFQLALMPSSRWSLYFNAMAGPEQRDNDRDERCLYNVVGSYKPTSNWTLGFDLLRGTEDGLLENGGTASWSGCAGYLRYNFTGRFALGFRAEIFEDDGGTRTGTPQTLREVTVTPEFKLGKHFVLRGDLRRDWSDAPVFEKRSTSCQGQTTVIVALCFVH